MTTFRHGHWLPYYSFIGGLHLLGLAFLMLAAGKYPAFWGLGFLAYTLGLRHAFDADHISAIDNTVRKLVQQRQPSYGVGFWFSLGHSTVVLIMSLTVTLSVKWALKHMPSFQKIGAVIGTTVSGLFLLLVAAFNIIVLIGLLRSLHHTKEITTSDDMEALLLSRGILSRIWQPLFKVVKHSRQMFPIGFLFGLGFDTATEITLLALTAQSSQRNIPILGLMALPILFTAGMNLLDTTDSVMMANAYQWAFKAPLRKLYYNIVVTLVSVIAAVSIGLVELLQVAKNVFKFSGSFWLWIQNVDLNWLGFGLVGIFMTMWGIAYLIWRVNKQSRLRAD